MIKRIYVEKKEPYATESKNLIYEITELLGIKGVQGLRIINRYYVEDVEEDTFELAVNGIFSEPQVDNTYKNLDVDKNDIVFAVEFLPGQFDQRADSAAQCIQILTQHERPLVSSAKVYVISGNVSDSDLDRIKKYVINPVEAREATLDIPHTLKVDYEVPKDVAVLDGFNSLDENGLQDFVKTLGLAMDLADIKFCQQYFKDTEKRSPTITEIRMIDTYWSDHCRHTTFSTIIDNVKFEDDLVQATYKDYVKQREKLGIKKPICLMDLATVAVKYLRKNGKLDKLDESEEINACTVKMDIDVDGKPEPWLLLFKNETHNHPTEIEPFGGAATCIGGAIRDPLSGRSYVYGAMRVTGAGDPTVSISDTLPGKLPQRKIVTTAANGYSSYGNQIGLATGIVDEIYHPGYIAKRMEIGAVIGAAPAKNVRRERPAAGDAVVYLGGKTGRDGIGGATGSSKAHDSHSVETCGAEVQKGNAPEERKLQRFFRNGDVTRLIKRCNDFGAGGVSVAIGELADGLDINLDAVPKKYEGLDGTELAISESQERMAVCVAAKDLDEFLRLAETENLLACKVADVTDTNRLKMTWRGNTIVDISRDFLNSNGAEKHTEAIVGEQKIEKLNIPENFCLGMRNVASDLNTASKRGLAERFDSTIGCGGVLMPFGGKYQLTPVQAMVQRVSVEEGHTDTCSLMSFGFNPFISEISPYYGAYLAVVESVCKLISSGAEFSDVYLTFQEYFEKLGDCPEKWGKPLCALLGAYKAQMDLQIGSIGGKDSMSGSFEDIYVPPTLVSFAVTTTKIDNVCSPEFKNSGNEVVLVKPKVLDNGLFDAESLIATFNFINKLQRESTAKAVYTPGMGGVCEAIMKMSFGNKFGFNFDNSLPLADIFEYCYGCFVVEVDNQSRANVDNSNDHYKVVKLGNINNTEKFTYIDKEVSLQDVSSLYENKLEDVYSCNIKNEDTPVHNVEFNNTDYFPIPSVKSAKPNVVIPVFPGNNCEYDTAKVFVDAGAKCETFVINNLTSDGIKRNVENFSKLVDQSQILFIPGGFSAGDEPDGSGKFITSFFKNQSVAASVMDLLDNRGGLIAGVCNGFQALVKLGLVPYGKIIQTDKDCPTLTYNTISRHQSKIVRTRICSNKSPWFSQLNVGDIINVAISHGEGRFIANDSTINELIKNGQVATQYVDLEGNATNDIAFNPNNSNYAIEGITSYDGRVLGKMGHSERWAEGLYKNVPGNYDYKMFESAVKFFA